MSHEIPQQPSDKEYERHAVLKESIAQSILKKRPWPYGGSEGEPRLLSIQWMSLQYAEDGWSATGLTTDGCYVRADISNNADDVILEVEAMQSDGETGASQSS